MPNELFIWRLAARFFTVFSMYFSDSAQLDVESRLSRDFFGSPRWPTVAGHRGLMPIRSCSSVDKDKTPR